MSMIIQKLAVVFLCLTLCFAQASLASRGKGPGIPWQTIEEDMRREGCFVPPISTLQDALLSEDTLCRWRAVRALGLRGDKEAIPRLRAIQEQDSDGGTREQAAVALVQLGERDYLFVLQKQMDQSASLREKLALAGELANLGDAGGSRYLEEACRSSALQDRSDCAWQITKFTSLAGRDDQLGRLLIDLALRLSEESDPALRRDGLIALRDVGAGVVLQAPVLMRITHLATASPDPETQRLAQRVLDSQEERSHPPNRLFEIYRLGSAGDKSAIPELKTIYDGDPDPQARHTAALSLVRLGERSYLEPLRKIMEESPDDDLFLEGELARLGDWSGYAHVAEACRSTDAKRRLSCAGVLHKFAPLAKQKEDFLATFMDQALDLVEDSDPQVRSLATVELESHCRALRLTPLMVTRLEKLAATSVYPEVREMARAAVEEHRRKKPSATEPKP